MRLCSLNFFNVSRQILLPNDFYSTNTRGIQTYVRLKNTRVLFLLQFCGISRMRIFAGKSLYPSGLQPLQKFGVGNEIHLMRLTSFISVHLCIALLTLDLTRLFRRLIARKLVRSLFVTKLFMRLNFERAYPFPLIYISRGM